ATVSEVADDLAAAAGGNGLQVLELDGGADGAHAAVGEPGIGGLVQGTRAGQRALAATVDVGPGVVGLAVDAHGRTEETTVQPGQTTLAADVLVVLEVLHPG